MRPLLCLALVAVGLGASAPGAAGRTLAPLSASHPPTRGVLPTGPLPDRVLQRPPRLARSAQNPARTYVAFDGTPVEIQLSRSFADTPENRAAAQSFADFIASRLHGDELRRLRVAIGTNAEISAICGGGADTLACYEPSDRRMFVPSDEPRRGGYTRAYVATHEYAHHVARSRRNDPFSALAFGPKYWSSYERVCDGVDRRRLTVGGGSNGYFRDAGEGWAEAYAHLHYPEVRYQLTPRLRPDAGAFAAIRRDVLQPWSGPVGRMISGSLNGARRVRSTSVRLSLDGTLRLTLSGPARSDFALEVLQGRRVLARTRTGGSADRLSGLFCRSFANVETVRVRVRRLSGGGAFRLRISYPG